DDCGLRGALLAAHQDAPDPGGDRVQQQRQFQIVHADDGAEGIVGVQSVTFRLIWAIRQPFPVETRAVVDKGVMSMRSAAVTSTPRAWASAARMTPESQTAIPDTPVSSQAATRAARPARLSPPYGTARGGARQPARPSGSRAATRVYGRPAQRRWSASASAATGRAASSSASHVSSAARAGDDHASAPDSVPARRRAPARPPASAAPPAGKRASRIPADVACRTNSTPIRLVPRRARDAAPGRTPIRTGLRTPPRTPAGYRATRPGTPTAGRRGTRPAPRSPRAAPATPPRPAPGR